MDLSVSFHKHGHSVSDIIDKRNNMLKALAGSSWGQENRNTCVVDSAIQLQGNNRVLK